ncbi:MAG: sulfotransferase [Pseudomonadota bacterium]
MLTTIGPNFIGIGMERAATSWVQKMLVAHPDIWVPPVKSLHYFNRIEKGYSHDKSRFRRYLLRRLADRKAIFKRNPDRPELYKNSLFRQVQWDWAYFSGRKSNTWYQNLFHARYTKGRVCGEITPNYSKISPSIVKRMTNDFPDAKLILMLRHPYDRLRSGLFYHFKHEQNRRFFMVEDFEMEEYLRQDEVLHKSSPTAILNKWTRHVSEDRLFIGVQTNDMSEYVEDFLKEIYSFVGVDPSFIPDSAFTKPKVNAHTQSDEEDYLPRAVEAMIHDFAAHEMERLRESYPHIANIWDFAAEQEATDHAAEQQLLSAE